MGDKDPGKSATDRDEEREQNGKTKEMEAELQEKLEEIKGQEGMSQGAP